MLGDPFWERWQTVLFVSHAHKNTDLNQTISSKGQRGHRTWSRQTPAASRTFMNSAGVSAPVKPPTGQTSGQLHRCSPSQKRKRSSSPFFERVPTLIWINTSVWQIKTPSVPVMSHWTWYKTNLNTLFTYGRHKRGWQPRRGRKKPQSCKCFPGVFPEIK